MMTRIIERAKEFETESARLRGLVETLQVSIKEGYSVECVSYNRARVKDQIEVLQHMLKMVEGLSLYLAYSYKQPFDV